MSYVNSVKCIFSFGPLRVFWWARPSNPFLEFSRNPPVYSLWFGRLDIIWLGFRKRA